MIMKLNIPPLMYRIYISYNEICMQFIFNYYFAMALKLLINTNPSQLKVGM